LSLEKLALQYEKLNTRISKQYYYQYAGLAYDRDLMKKLAQQLCVISKEFLTKYSEPRRMYLASVETIADAERLEVDLDFHDQRMEKIATGRYRIADKKVNWGNWRQFNSQTEDHKKRKTVFDEFVSKASSISKFVDKRMGIAKEIYQRYNLTPLESYLELEQLNYSELLNLLQKLGDEAKETFLAATNYFAPEVLRKDIVEYYDDFYTWRGRIFKPLNRYFEGKDPMVEIRKILRGIGFDPTKIKVDDKDRPNKSPSASCWGIQIPKDVRILYRKVTPYSDFTMLFHEFGHGIHGRSANPDDSVWKRYIIPRSVAETFSILIESIVGDPVFLSDGLKLPSKAVNEILDRVRFMNLAFLTFYAANSIMKLEFWKENYTIEEAADRWQELTKRFFIETPGYYWVLHHVMPNYDLYSPSYMVASVRVSTIKDHLKSEYGEAWWRSKDAGGFIKNLAETRGEFKVKAWKLNPERYLNEQKSLSFLN
jgi:phosphoribosyl-ATP pyrophosphohydrolase